MLFKIWNMTRLKKVFVSLDEQSYQGNLYENLILKASEKLKINGSWLVLEADGTCVDDDDTLKALTHNDILILLQPGEFWQDLHSKQHTVQSASTVSYCSIGSDIDKDINQSLDASCSSIDSDTSPYSPDGCRVSETTWKNFKIPWDKISENNIKICESGKPATKQLFKAVLNPISEALRDIKKHVPEWAIKVTSEKIVSKYPGAFKDIDDDKVVFGSGTHTVFSKIKEHIKFLNRSGPNKRSHDGSVDETIIPLKQRKKILVAKAGITNYQPELSAIHNAEDIRIKLKEKNFNDLDEEAGEWLKITYPEQRRFLNSIPPPPLNEIKDKWPVLLSRNGIFYHYRLLMEQNIQQLSETIIAKSDKILKLGMEKKYIPNDPIMTENDKIIAVLRTITKYFSEDFTMIYRVVNRESDIEAMAKHLAPCIVASEEDPIGKMFYVILESEKVNEGTLDLKHAIHQTFALFYNLNLEYPKGVSNTWEFVQRYIVKIHPDQGTKNKKSSKQKIISLINKLRN